MMMGPFEFLIFFFMLVSCSNAALFGKKEPALEAAVALEGSNNPEAELVAKELYSKENGVWNLPIAPGKKIQLSGSLGVSYNKEKKPLVAAEAAEVEKVEAVKEIGEAEAKKAIVTTKQRSGGSIAPVVVANDMQQAILSDPKAYPLRLSNIHTSHGVLVPDFSPEILTYRLELLTPHDQLAIVPEIDHSRLEYMGEPNMPIVTMSWRGNNDALPEPAAIAIRKQIDLPDDGRDLAVFVSVANPHFPSHSQTYRVTVHQAAPPLPLLKFFDGVDEYGDSLLIEPPTSQDASIYNVLTNPRASRVTLKPICSTGSWLTVDGITRPSGSGVILPRERNHHTQVVEIVCGKGGITDAGHHRTYVALIKSDWPLHEIPIPRLTVEDVGRECIFEPKRSEFQCPDPKTATGRTRVVAFNEASIKYTIEDSRKNTEVRLLNKMPSIPFTYKSGLFVVAEAGQFTQAWPIVFDSVGYPGIMQMLGWVLAFSLAVLLLALLLLVGFASVCGLGVPQGATEIAATLTLIIQYFCFANFMRGSTTLTEMTTPLKWVTMFWPLPWHVGDTLQRRKLLEISSFSSAYGLELWGESSLGDVTDIRNACGCLFWCLMAFVVMCGVHALVYAKFALWEKDHTFPHRLKLGNWESRALHWLCFPVCTAAAMILTADITTTLWKGLAAVAFVIYGGWICTVLFTVQSAVSHQKVCWVWNSSVREDGELEDDSGYWADVVCNQLLTQSVNRGLCRDFFNWNWVATVGDIEPVAINQALFSRAEIGADVYGPNHYPRAHNESSYTLAKYPKAVEVTGARHPHGFCKGSRLIAGLLRTNWLDILFTYESLAKFHHCVLEETGRHVNVPLTVKTQQLSGPYASGANAYFFDGARVPFIRIADTFFRMLLGVFIGVALASEGYKVDAAMFASVGVMACACVAYVAFVMPYSRKYENWMIVGTQAVIGLSGFSFCYYAFKRRDPSSVADIFLWIVALACFALAAYSSIVTFSVFSALICPPLEESRFLEKLANCNVTISDHARAFATEMPGYSKFGARDLKAQCTMTSGNRVHVSIFPSGDEAAFEFDVRDIKQACRTGELAPPALTLYTPSPESPLGYKHVNVVVGPNSTVRGQVEGFLASEAATSAISREVAEHIAHQVEMRGKGRAILSVTVIPPRGAEYTALSTSKSAVRHRSTTTSSSSVTSSSNNKSRERSSSKHRSSSRRSNSSHHHSKRQ